MIKVNTTSKGFTLVETVISLTVVAILLTVIANFSISTLSQSSVEASRANLLSESQIAMDRVINDIRLSSGADESNRYADPNNPDGSLAWESTSGTLVLATAVQDASNTIIFADPTKYISEKNNVVYFVKDKVLYKRVLASPVANNAAVTTCPAAAATTVCPADRALLSNVTNFSIKYLNGDDQEVIPTESRSIELTVQTAVSKFSQNITSNYTTRAVFRND
ncbi:MAG: PulJ/GspJ family protein [Candidatus Saccharimonadales bacterium]